MRLSLRRPKQNTTCEAEVALAKATESLTRVRDRDGEVEEVVKSLRLIRERNHFAERLQIVMGGNYDNL